MCSGVRVHLFLDMPRACEPVGIQYETYIEEDTVAKTCVFVFVAIWNYIGQ